MSTSIWGVGEQPILNANGTLIFESIIGIQGQVVFNITEFAYVPGSSSIIVFINGQKQDVDQDYLETSTTSITLLEGVIAGDKVSIIGFPQINLTQFITPPAPPGSSIYINLVSDCGAVGDGIADDTAAFTAGITESILTGRTVYIPPTTASYRVTAPITVAGPAKFLGGGVTPYLNGPSGLKGKGSWIQFDHLGKGFNITAGTNFSGVQFINLGAFRNQPVPSGGWAPLAADYDIFVGNAEVYINNVCLLNPTKGVELVGASYGRLIIEGLYGQPMQRGIHINGSTASTKLHNIHFWSYWQHQVNIHTYTQANLIPLQLESCDHLIVSDFYCKNLKTGVLFGNAGTGPAYRAEFSNFNLDLCSTRGVDVAAAAIGTNAQFANTSIAMTGNTSVGIEVQTNDSYLQFSNIRIENCGASGIYMGGLGNNVDCGNIELINYNTSNTAAQAIFSAVGNKIRISEAWFAPAFPSALTNYTLGISLNQTFAGDWALLAGTTSIAVNHNLGIIPLPWQISLFFRQDPLVGRFWIDDAITTTQFIIRCAVAPGAPGAFGSWLVDFRS